MRVKLLVVLVERHLAGQTLGLEVLKESCIVLRGLRLLLNQATELSVVVQGMIELGGGNLLFLC